MKLRVEAVVPTTPEVVLLTLRHPRNPELPAWTPGAHIDLRLSDGRIRQYSLCGDPDVRATYQIAVKREDMGRGGSRWVHQTILPGAEAHVSHPRNHFPLKSRHRSILVAGGIGVTPCLPMARQLARDDADFTIHFCARSAETAPLLADLQAICGPRLRTWFSGDGRRFDPILIGPPDDDAHLYACGPARLLASVNAAAETLGWPDERRHSEVFQATLDENYKPEPFDARIASTGAVLHIPADRSLLEVLRANGFPIASSCELGVCGSCVCGYSDGVVIHRDSMLPLAARQDRLTTCVSRARVSVTLDL